MLIRETMVRHIMFSYLFLVLAALFGLLYALQLTGIGEELIRPDLVRSLHISLMLYGFPTLMLTLLPFALFEKEGVMDKEGVSYLQKFLYVWYIFLLFMIVSLLYGATRGLPFYDFPYELNFLLALAGFFYIIAIFKSIRNYEVRPLWVNVSLVMVIISPFALLVLMNPDYGQVEKMLKGPHGDNTLGMSFALVVLYYLTMKLASSHKKFSTKWHILWIIPLLGYVLSVLYRSFIGNLSYHAEWALQYLTLLYIPLLYRWWKDAGLRIKENIALFLSLGAFIFADIEGNILFVPQIREMFHRNDLVVGHAHIAVGIAFLFLAFAVIQPFYRIGMRKLFYLASMLVMMALVLSISGFEQAGFMPMHTAYLWGWRALFGAMFLVGLLWFFSITEYAGAMIRRIWGKPLLMYHLTGFLSDGIGGMLLLFFGPALYGFIGQTYASGYQQIVFGFVASIGLIHLMAIFREKEAGTLADVTVIARVITAAGFFALYKTDVLGWIALAISMVDLGFVLVYLSYIRKDNNEKHTTL